jgi:hypothetical protein
VHRTVSGAQAGACDELAALGKSWGSHDYNSLDCLVCTGLSGEPAAPVPTVGSAISERRVARANGHKAAPNCPVCHRTVRCAKGVMAAMVGFARKGRRSHTVHCPVRPRTEGNYCLPNEAPTVPSCLGAIKGTPRCMEQYTKHLLNILKCRDLAFTHLIHCDRDSSTFLSCNSVVLLLCARSRLVCVC